MYEGKRKYGSGTASCLNTIVQRIAPSGSGMYTISKKGYNIYNVAQSMDKAVLSVPKKRKIYLHITDFPTSSPSLNSGVKDSIHDKSNDPLCLIDPYSSSHSGYLIRVSGAPGQHFTLKTLESFSTSIGTQKSGTHWISTIHTGF